MVEVKFCFLTDGPLLSHGVHKLIDFSVSLSEIDLHFLDLSKNLIDFIVGDAGLRNIILWYFGNF